MVVLWDNVLDRAVSSMQLPGSCDSQACIINDATWAIAMIRDCWLRKTTLARYSCRDWWKITTYFESEDRHVSQITLCDDNSKLLAREHGVKVWDVATGIHPLSGREGASYSVVPLEKKFNNVSDWSKITSVFAADL